MIGTAYPILVVCRVDATHDCYYSYTLKIAIMNNDTSLCAKVKYVHELQHALRLCGLSELADNLKI